MRGEEITRCIQHQRVMMPVGDRKRASTRCFMVGFSPMFILSFVAFAHSLYLNPKYKICARFLVCSYVMVVVLPN